jgi:streptogramin lyase
VSVPNHREEGSVRSTPTLFQGTAQPLLCLPGRLLIALATLLLTASFTVLGQVGPRYAWTNFAGKPGGIGTTDGPAGVGRLSFPYGITLCTNGNFLVTDSSIRIMTPSAVLTTLAGRTNYSGTNDGIGSLAQFRAPSGVALDRSGNAFVADTFSHTIRRVTPSGEVTTVAGTAGVPGSADGSGTAAQFSSPCSVAVNNAGEVFVTDFDNNTIRKITASGDVTTFVGKAGFSGSVDSTNSAARFWGPDGLTIDASGSLYVTDNKNSTIRKVTPLGAVSTLAGKAPNAGTADGTNSIARFRNPYAVTLDGGGNLFVADTKSHTIRKVAINGTNAVVTTIAGGAGIAGYADGNGLAARFNEPSGLVMDTASNLFVVDSLNFCIRMITAAGDVTTFAGRAPNAGSTNGVGDAARFNEPFSVAVDSLGNVFVADYLNDTIRKATPNGIVTTFAGSLGAHGSLNGNGNAARFNLPSGLSLDSGDNIFVADTANGAIRKITPAADVTTIVGGLSNPQGVAVDTSGNVLFTEQNRHWIRKISPLGNVSVFAGDSAISGITNGMGTAARFNSPHGLAFDSLDNLFVADMLNHAIRRISPDGMVTTFAGTSGTAAIADGFRTTALFDLPWYLTLDSVGNLFVAESGCGTIRMVTHTGFVFTIGGNPRVTGAVEGLASDALFARPYGIAVSSAGFLYVSDIYNNNIWKGTPAAPYCDAYAQTPSGFEFTISGLLGRGPVTVYRSSDLLQWDILTTHSSVTGRLHVIDADALGFPIRYYKASE